MKRDLPKESRHLILAVSAGLDSLALVYFFLRTQRSHKLSFSILHVHHGPSHDPVLSKYRDQAQQVAEDLGRRYQLSVETFVYQGPELHSENEFRKLRQRAYAAELKKYGTGAVLVLGHHRDDLLETRILRLLRGTGTRGLRAMRTYQKYVYRPWLTASKAEIVDYLNSVPHDLKPVQDPSNQDSKYLRNWVREVWLPQLENRQKGAVAALARSLGNLAEVDARLWVHQGRLDRVRWNLLSSDQKIHVLAQLIQRLNPSPETVQEQAFEVRHLKELSKRLDIVKNDHTFQYRGLKWSLKPTQILVVNPRK